METNNEMVFRVFEAKTCEKNAEEVCECIEAYQLTKC